MDHQEPSVYGVRLGRSLVRIIERFSGHCYKIGELVRLDGTRNCGSYGTGNPNYGWLSSHEFILDTSEEAYFRARMIIEQGARASKSSVPKDYTQSNYLRSSSTDYAAYSSSISEKTTKELDEKFFRVNVIQLNQHN